MDFYEHVNQQEEFKGKLKYQILILSEKGKENKLCMLNENKKILLPF